MNIELSKYRWAERAADAGLGPLLPPAFEDQQSRRFEAERQDAVRGLTGATQVLADLHEAVANPGRAEAPRQALDRKAEALRRELPPSAWHYLEPLRPLTESVVEPLEEQRREAGLAELGGALAGQKAALRQLARIGAPLPTLLGVARGLLDRLQAGGLLLGERALLEASWAEELAANRLAGRLERLGDAPLSAQPEAAYLSPEALLQLEELQRRQQAAEQEQRLGAALESAVGSVTGGGQATPEQAAAIEQALPGWSEAAGQEVETWQRRQDSLAALLEQKPILGRLKTLNDGLYRRLLVDEQRRLGVPEDRIRVWDRAESDAKVAAWAELPPADEVPKHVRGKAVVDYARQHLADLPADLVPLAIDELRRRGLSDAEARLLGDLTLQLQERRDLGAIARAESNGAAGIRTSSRDSNRRSRTASGLVVPAPPLRGLGLTQTDDTFDPGRALERLFDSDTWISTQDRKDSAALSRLGHTLEELAAEGLVEPGSPLDQLPPVKPQPPEDFDTEEAARIAKELFGPLATPADLAPIFQLEGFTLEDFQSGAVTEIFPDSSYDLPQATILENSRGGPPVRADLSKICEDLISEIQNAVGRKLDPKEWFGGEAFGNYREEKYFRHPDTGRTGSARTDCSVPIPGTNLWIHVNSVDADRFGQPTGRENDSAARILRHAKHHQGNGHVIILIPKLRPGETYDREALRSVFRELVYAMSQNDWLFRWVERGLDERSKLVPR